jgi:preprotein translocase subunit SecA
VVDEADGILIDAANTPLIIGTPARENQRTAAECFHWAARNAARFEDQVHYTYDHKKKSVELSSAGRRLARTLSKPDALDSVGTFPTYEYVERAIKVERAFLRDQQYVVRDGEVVVVDEYSGRLSEGVKWSDGIHEAVEAKEQIPVHVQPGHSARVTVQDFFMRYPKLAGMTGTAVTSARELRRIYKVHVVAVPPNRPVVRERLPTRVFGGKQRKWEAIVTEAAELAAQGRPVLIGTRSIDKSQELSCLLAAANIEHQVLNARQVDREAEIVARAGERGKVTVSTNMAGRGTDIQLGNGVAELGGLHVVLTELHEAARIDRQLTGRCGRQGDPGSFRQYLALDDEILLAGLGAEQAEFLADFGKSSTGPFDYTEWLFLKAQRALERRHFRGRRWLMHHEKERKKLKKQMGQDPYLD